MVLRISKVRVQMSRVLSGALLVGGLAVPAIFAPKARAQDKAIYYDAKYSTGWLSDAAGRQMAAYFAGKGYQVLDANGVKTFMQAHITSKAPSVVVMGKDQPPDTIVDVSSGAVVATGNVYTDYMNAGGHVVAVGDWPFYNIALTAGGTLIPQPGPAGATTILGIPGSDTSTGCTNDSLKPVVFTAEGTKEGLTTPWPSQRVIPDSDADLVLAESAEGADVSGGCAAGWIKKFPDANGSGEFIRIDDYVIPSLNNAQLKDIQSVAEYGFPKSADTVAPSAVTDVAVTNPTSTGATLTFTAPADTGTGSSGSASSYEIRYSTQPITAANVGSALVEGAAASKAGTKESIALTGLDPLQHYYVTVIAHDSGGNASAISNVAEVTTGFVSFPTLPKVVDKAVFYDPSYTTNWVDATAAMVSQAYFVAQGYTLVDGPGLATFMMAHVTSKVPSAVVMAQDVFPDTVIDISSGAVTSKNLINDYMNNGGRVIDYGDWPFYNIALTGGGYLAPNPGGNGGPVILGFNVASGAQTALTTSVTPTGTALGLKSTWSSQRPTDPSLVDVVLDSTANGAAGWIKFEPGPTGPGFFARLYDTTTSSQTPDQLTTDQLADGQKLAEFSGTLAQSPARISGTVADASGNPIVGATITVTPAGGGSALTAISNSQGIYSTLLNPGMYTVSGSGETSSGVVGTGSATGPTTVTLGQIATGPSLVLAPKPLPTLTAVASADKAVFYDANYPPSWVPDADAQQIRDYFQGKGYMVLDATGLATFMQAHTTSKTPSVVVMSQDIFPDTVVDVSSGAVVAKNILTDYLNAGGRVVNFGDIPLYNIGQGGTSGNITAAGAGATTVLGFNASGGTWGLADTTTLTPIASALGLSSTWSSLRPANPSDVDVVLGNAQGGAAGWIKFFPNSTGTGEFIRLIDNNLAVTPNIPLTDAQLADAQKLAELSGPFPTVGGGTPLILGDPLGNGKITIGDATFVLQVVVKLKTPTAAQMTASDVDKDGAITIKDVTKILQAIVNGTGF